MTSRRCERGVKMRTLYQHSARHSPATREYVADIVARGAEVRTLDEFFRRLIVVDRQVAIVPASDNHHVAIAIHDKSLIAYLVDIFERSWERAQPFNLSGNQAERNIAADVRAMTIRLLVEGHSDPASAKRLGVSTRTYAGYIAALKDEYGVQTRFQLGYAMSADTPGRRTRSSTARRRGGRRRGRPGRAGEAHPVRPGVRREGSRLGDCPRGWAENRPGGGTGTNCRGDDSFVRSQPVAHHDSRGVGADARLWGP